VGGVLVSPNEGGVQLAAAYIRSDTELFYVNTSEEFSLRYRLHTADSKVTGYDGDAEHYVGGLGAALRAIDPKTGKLRWIHPYPGAEGGPPRPQYLAGLLTTAGHLLFGGGPSSHLICYDPQTGNPVAFGPRRRG